MSEVARISTPDGDVAVKTFAPDESERAQREAAILRHLAARSGRYRAQTLVSGGGALVTRWLPGRKKVYTEISVAEWRALGETLAALHAALDDLTFPLPAMPAMPAVTTLDVASLRARVSAPEMHRYLDARLLLFEAHAEPARRAPLALAGPVHGDFNQHNYLFDGELPPIVLDWDRALSAPREWEVVRCLNHLPLVAPDHAAAFVAGYRDVRTLDADALRWAVHRTLVDQAMKGWPLERWLAGDPGAESMLRGSMEIVHALHDGSGRLAEFFVEAVQ